ALEDVTIGITQANPEPVELWPTEESFAVRLEIVGELTNEVNRANARERNGLVLTIRCKQVDGVGLAQAGRAKVAAGGLASGKHYDNILVRGCCGPRLQEWLRSDGKAPNLRIGDSYVMLSSVFVSTHYFS